MQGRWRDLQARLVGLSLGAILVVGKAMEILLDGLQDRDDDFSTS
ncbi:hypothetical protein ACFSHP_26285 [Novosphingobium panipatense]